MKNSLNQFRPGFLVMLGVFALAGGCKKDNEPTSGLSAKIQTIVPQATLDDLKAKGIRINEGSAPPNIEGIFVVNPMRLLSPYNSDDTYSKGRVIDDQTYKFYEQSGSTIKMEFKEGTTKRPVSTGELSGSGNKFTLFINTNQTLMPENIDYSTLRVISGEIGTGGIINFQTATTLTKKNGDSKNLILIPINQARVWEDGDQLAKKVSTY
ncbi:hypothetical protein [Larkinella terrae]|uniref:Lipoprotein n=1 Tax=Larkinella terrae TaxID=2025311 RepID=A0A7K0EUR6_9BACT|nr:hypothetical protein [Larkinella terrae]MRS65499.1 hypothetical protein [Larkinella terrae]